MTNRLIFSNVCYNVFFVNTAVNVFLWFEGGEKKPHIKFKTIFQKLSDSIVSSPCFSSGGEGSPAEPTLISLHSISQPVVGSENV